MPIPEQREHFIARWGAPGREVASVPLLPSAMATEIEAAGTAMAELAPTW